MKSIEQLFIRCTGYVCSALFFVMISVSLLQVFFRYVLNDSLTWSEELARYLFVWVSFLGSIIALHRGLHIEVDVVTSMVGETAKRHLALAAKVCVIALLLVLTTYGWRIVMLTWDAPSAALRIPMALVYLAIPLGAMGMLAVTVFQMVRTWARDDT
ncbi:TRAP transporter small permease [Xanthobacteraceae bacterium Astr-EGSB]|uniref:TRAP transporter small permease n=1 Tax=Astrobacterium formosum TaxID=3069710 RepID=UPI0027B4A5C0|nr:TRAP transporter small permease [Xanthobacteraceae bacterium Astr-EGSB]